MDVHLPQPTKWGFPVMAALLIFCVFATIHFISGGNVRGDSVANSILSLGGPRAYFPLSQALGPSGPGDPFYASAFDGFRATMGEGALRMNMAEDAPPSR